MPGSGARLWQAGQHVPRRVAEDPEIFHEALAIGGGKWLQEVPLDIVHVHEGRRTAVWSPRAVNRTSRLRRSSGASGRSTSPAASIRSTSRVAPPVVSTCSWAMAPMDRPGSPARPRISSTSNIRWLIPHSSSIARPSRYPSRLAAPCNRPKARISSWSAASCAVEIPGCSLTTHQPFIPRPDCTDLAVPAGRTAPPKS